MEILVSTISITLLLLLILTPIFLFISIKRRKTEKSIFFLYIFSAILTTSIITLLFAWWSDYSNQLLMSNYGYNFDAMSDVERFSNVKGENTERVKRLEISYYGIGWPLKTILTYVFYLPYLLIVYLVGYFLTKKRFLLS